MRNFIERQVEQAWYGDRGWTRALAPLVPLYRQAALKAMVRGQINAQNNPLDIPVVVVGNITAGGTGKSPVVISLAKELRSRGYSPGVLSRGYGSEISDHSYQVSIDDSAIKVGDEPLMMATLLPDMPVVVDRDRSRGAHYLRDRCKVNIVICDDGLQHYALARDIELVILDSKRGIGNGRLIPAGPLRESVERLDRVDFVLANGAKDSLSKELQVKVDYEFSVLPSVWRNLDSEKAYALDQLPISGKVFALSAIGNPERFYRTLESLGLEIIPQAFADHHKYKQADFDFINALPDTPVVMTAKDAVKCKAIGQQLNKNNWWVLEVEARLPDAFIEELIEKLKQIESRKKTENRN